MFRPDDAGEPKALAMIGSASIKLRRWPCQSRGGIGVAPVAIYALLQLKNFY